jgi:ATP-dependent helicase/DNAse subunit B
VFSATEIEAYLQCPFLWFVEHVIRPREIGVHVDAAAAGRLGHEIMYHFYDEFIDRTGAPRVSPETLSVARDVHRSVSDRLVRGVRTESVVDDVALRRAVIHTLRLVEADATILEGMAPIHREWTFGMDDDPEPFGGFALAGRVDRIDADETRLVVTDYKRGAPGPERCGARFATEGLVQLPLYAAVASRRLDRSIAGGVYRSGACPKPRGFIHSDVADRAFVSTDIFEADAIETLVADAIRRSGEAIEGIRAGRIAADPLGGACPGYCPARGFCAEGRRAGG